MSVRRMLRRGRRRSHLIICVMAVLLRISLGSEAVKLDRVSLRLSYRDQHERITRRSVSAEAVGFSASGASLVVADATDTVVAQAACIAEKTGDVAFPQQAFLRFVRKDSGADSIYVMRKKSVENRVELNLLKEIQSDKDFWTSDVSYRVEIVVGDTRMQKGVTWVAIDTLRFSPLSGKHFQTRARGVFDFDVSVKKGPLPEFTSPIPPGEREAPFVASVVALCAVLAPFPLVLYAWKELGVFPLSLPDNRAERSSVIAFETCLLAHMGALLMFWLQWNILVTWKVMAALMLPTFFFGHRALSPAASRHVRCMSTIKKGS